MYLLNGNFGDYAQLFKDGTLMFGDYWHHLKVHSSKGRLLLLVNDCLIKI